MPNARPARPTSSQAGEGWKLIPTEHGDGGCSGGTLERHGITRLLADMIQDGDRREVLVSRSSRHVVR
jgi:hypothetical protein